MYLTWRVPVAVAVVAVAGALIPAPGVLVFQAGLVAVLLAVGADVRFAPRARDLAVSRVHPAVVGMGRSATVAITIHNPLERLLRVTLRDASPPSLRREPVVQRLALGPGAWRSAAAGIRPTRRGYVALGPLTVRTEGPLRLAGRQATLGLHDRLKVYPALPGRAEVALHVDRARLLEAGVRSSRLRGGGTDFESLREYRPDDELRRINWRATARAVRAISNDYREERNQQVLLLLDAGRTMAGSVAGVSRFEHAVDAAVAVGELASRVGDQVGMVVFGKGLRAMVEPRSGRAQPRRILDQLFDLQPSLEAANYPLAFGAVLSRHRRRSLIVLLTELSDESVLEPLSAAVPVLLSRHLVLIGAVRDPEVEAMARSLPSTSEEVYLKAAAAGAVAARDRAAGLLGRLGSVVVDAPAGALAGRLADQYLKIKSLGRL